MTEGEMVLDTDEDEFHIITHPTYTETGSSLFSLETFELYQDSSQDILREITTYYWSLYKGGVLTSSPTVPFFTGYYACYFYFNQVTMNHQDRKDFLRKI